MSKHVVVIPIYRSILSDKEIISLTQCCKILSAHDLYLISPASLNCDKYYENAHQYGVELHRETFAEQFFNGIRGYNQLCMTPSFYERFRSYDYMLIYQLDAYVFRDELDSWCNKGYDYIGAPWFEKYGSHEEGNQLWRVGNGGFSLRKIDWFIRFLNCKRLYGWKELKERYYLGTFKSLLVCIHHWLGYWQSAKCLVSESGDHEDLIVTFQAGKTKLKPKIPTCEEAMYFSFEQSPSYLFSLTKELPFGCHAWEKFEYEEFWKQYIR